ncbi:MAG: ribonuclease G [Candidatus Schekmanbacteria bacterium GWA2_38_9]|nr:MAG: ribonuclease G [Candidatus Schekmanbacteria bacterium GWA2_38_9]
MSREIIINSTSQETRIAVLENNLLSEIFTERKKEKGINGNIYKGKVSKVLPGMQAAFIDIGMDKAGFLHASDIADDARAYEKLLDEDKDISQDKLDDEIFENEEEVSISKDSSLQIEDLLKKGQEILVQVSREPIGSKGPRLTSYITLPGRYLVFMPTVNHMGISRRIEDKGERARLKGIMNDLRTPNSGFIVRTASEGKSHEDFMSDMNFLKKLWGTVQERHDKRQAPCLVHADMDLVFRILRDLFTSDIERILVDFKADFERCLDFAEKYLPQHSGRIEFYEGKEPIFDLFGIEIEIDKALGRKIWLKSGGYIVIDQTEALVAIDVNTGKYVGKRNLEETILKTNLEAVKEIVYQIRLRNLGGIIIIDFIDMEKEESREKVFHALENAIKGDRLRTNILKISELGLVQMSRKRMRESLSQSLCQQCIYCDGKGLIKSSTTICYEIFREIARVAISESGKKIMVSVHPDVADMLYDEESAGIEELEKICQKKVIIKTDFDNHIEQYDIVAM